MIVAVDYGMGNLRSVQKAGEFLGKRIRITDKASTIRKADKIRIEKISEQRFAIFICRKFLSEATIHPPCITSYFWIIDRIK